MKPALLILLAAATVTALAQGPHAEETPKERDARMRWWREARFGMFIHWGLYAEPAGVWQGRRTDGLGEWIMHDLKIPVAEYKTLAQGFNPVEFDADRWAAVAKAAGMRYVVMTAKHHEGFAMFDSADPFSILRATPFGRDPIAEMAAACRRAGLKFGVYYSQAQDWNHPGGAAYGGPWDPAQAGDLGAYVRDVAAPQVRELMRYRPDILWWDTPVTMAKADVAALLAPLPKSIILNDRLGNGVPGDVVTPEQTIPANGFPGRDWETCMTINDTWGYKELDNDFKSGATLIRNLVAVASRGGNLLLNVGPDARGVIPPSEVGRLGEVGAWLRKNGRSVYGTTAGPYRKLPFRGGTTVRGDSLFLNVFEWPAEGLVLPGLKTRVKAARVLATGERLAFSQSEDGRLEVARPAPPRREGDFGQPIRVPDASTAVELVLQGPPVVEEPEYALDLSKARTLLAADADLAGNLQIEHEPPNVGYWTDPAGSVAWRVSAPKAITAPATVEYACADDSGGSAFEIEIDGKPTGVGGTVAPTGGWGEYRTLVLTGTLEIPAGLHTVRIVARSMPGPAVMNLRGLSFTP